MGQLPSHIFAALYRALTIPYTFNGALILPILGCFLLHITSPITKGCINSHGAPFHPVSLPNNRIWTHGAFTLPIVNFAALYIPLLARMVTYPFFLDCPYMFLVHFLLYVCTMCIFHSFISFWTILSMLYRMGHETFPFALFSTYFPCLLSWGITSSHVAFTKWGIHSFPL